MTAIGEQDLPRFLVEWYGRRTSEGFIREAAARLNQGVASTTAAGAEVHLLIALAIPKEDYAFGVFAAEDIDTVVRVCDFAGAPPARISAAVDANASSTAEHEGRAADDRR